MDGKSRITRLTAREKALEMLEKKSKHCSKDTILHSCIADARQCYAITQDSFYMDVELYLNYYDKILKEK